jgi:hypothetical protein
MTEEEMMGRARNTMRQDRGCLSMAGGICCVFVGPCPCCSVSAGNISTGRLYLSACVGGSFRDTELSFIAPLSGRRKLGCTNLVFAMPHRIARSIISHHSFHFLPFLPCILRSLPRFPWPPFDYSRYFWITQSRPARVFAAMLNSTQAGLSRSMEYSTL